MLQWLRSCQQQETCTTSLQLNKLEFYHCPKQYLLYYVPVCGGFVVYFLRLFNNKKNGKKEDMQQWQQRIFTKGKYSSKNIFKFFFPSLCWCAVIDPLD